MKHIRQLRVGGNVSRSDRKGLSAGVTESTVDPVRTVGCEIVKAEDVEVSAVGDSAAGACGGICRQGTIVKEGCIGATARVTRAITGDGSVGSAAIVDRTTGGAGVGRKRAIVQLTETCTAAAGTRGVVGEEAMIEDTAVRAATTTTAIPGSRVCQQSAVIQNAEVGTAALAGQVVEEGTVTQGSAV